MKKENRIKVKGWRTRLRYLQKVDLPRARLKSAYLIDKGNPNQEELEDAEYEIDSLQSRVSSIKKVIRQLKREK